MVIKYFIVDDKKVLMVYHGTRWGAKKIGTIIDSFLFKKDAFNKYSELAKAYYEL